jgi:hypothetical protein
MGVEKTYKESGGECGNRYEEELQRSRFGGDFFEKVK